MLAGTIGVTSGQVIHAGTDVTSMPAYRRARLGLVWTFQLASEFKRLTVLENLLVAAPGSAVTRSPEPCSVAATGGDGGGDRRAHGRCSRGSGCGTRTPTQAT